MVQVSFGITTLVAGPGAVEGAVRLGAMVIPTGTGVATSTEIQARMALAWGTTVWVCTPTYALQLARAAQALAYDPARSNVRLFVVGAEPLTPTLRRQIGEAWSCRTLDLLGCSESGPPIGGECDEKTHLHIFEDFFLYQVVDPDTGKEVPVGQDGSMVLTTLLRRSHPMIRYNTNDISCEAPGPCPACGRTLRRIVTPLKGRADDRIKFRGVYLFPPAVEEVVRQDSRSTGEYVIIAEGSEGREELLVHVEVASEATDTGSLSQELEVRIKSATGLRMKVIPRKEGEVRAEVVGFGGYKARRFIDRRPR